MRARLAAFGIWDALWSIMLIALFGAAGWILLVLVLITDSDPDTVKRPCYVEYEGRVMMLKCYQPRP